MRNNKSEGFTLIELLIVIAIIGILAAVLIPNLLAARASAVDRSAQAFGHNVVTAVAAEVSEDLQLDLTTILDDCTADPYVPVAGSNYEVSAPGFGWGAAPACVVSVDGSGNVQVDMVYLGGNDNAATIGNITGAKVN